MKKFLTRLVMVPLIFLGVMFAIANRQIVTVYFDPVSQDPGFLSLTLPLFMILLVMVALGVVIGGVVVWFRQGQWRRAARDRAAEVKRLEADNRRLSNELTALLEKHTLVRTLPSPDADASAI